MALKLNSRSAALYSDDVSAKAVVCAIKLLKKAPRHRMLFVTLANGIRDTISKEDMVFLKQKHFKLIDFFSKVVLFEVTREPDTIRLTPYLEASLDAHSFRLLHHSMRDFV